MALDILRSHKKTVTAWSGPEKEYGSAEGTRVKYLITFDGGAYRAEYCPLKESNPSMPKIGDMVLFKIKHRGKFGDEIELLLDATTVMNTIDGTPIETGRVVSMNGHPAVVALNAALKFHEISNGSKPFKKNDCKVEPPLLVSSVMETAEELYEWLLMKANGI